MKAASLQTMTVEELVELFTKIALAQDAAELRGEISKYNRLFDQMVGIEQELKGRPGDQRSILMPLLTHRNVQVRYTAAQSCRDIAPAAARKAFQDISDQNIYPQAANARLALKIMSGWRLPE